MTKHVLTANRLADGAVVYLTADGAWSDDLQSAASTATAQDADFAARAERAVAACEIVDPYVISVVTDGGLLRPGSQRERIRAAGPTVAAAAGTPASAQEAAHVSL